MAFTFYFSNDILKSGWHSKEAVPLFLFFRFLSACIPEVEQDHTSLLQTEEVIL